MSRMASSVRRRRDAGGEGHTPSGQARRRWTPYSTSPFPVAPQSERRGFLVAAVSYFSSSTSSSITFFCSGRSFGKESKKEGMSSASPPDLFTNFIVRI